MKNARRRARSSERANTWAPVEILQEISRDDTKKLCEPILALYQERGRAARRTELEPKLAEARSRPQDGPAEVC